MDLCEFEYIICTKIFPQYNPLTLGQTYIDIILPLVEWYLLTNGGTVKAATNNDLVVGGKVFKKVSADQVSWL